ncbi:S41 family peptidase [Psychrobacter sp.]|uniref:S41 family peptidase n=1 Tax=Psychrobacter sp. TaxID=56811 RepID=UPI003F9ACA19
MRPIYFMRSCLSKPSESKTIKSIIRPVLFKPVLALSILGVGGLSTAQAANQDSDYDSAASMSLISLNDEAVAAEDDSDNLSEVANMLEVADDTDDAIDSVRDESALDDELNNELDTDDVEAFDTEIPVESAQVPLNAISPETLKTFVAVVDLVRREYVDAVNDEVLFNNAMSGMLTKLDSHAEFLDAEAYENLRAFTEGDVGDVGIKATYQPNDGYWVITEVIDDSPADQKGIEVGDYLHRVGGFRLDDNRQANDVEQLLSGIAGTQVDVVTSKAGRRKHTTTLQRNNSHPQKIEIQLVDGIAVVKLPAFQNDSREKVLDGLIGLDAPISGVLLDMRDNPGGLLTSAVSIASLFMSDTDVVQVKARQSDPRILSTTGEAILKPLPVAVLQNRYSASAAEVLASSLQAENRATIIGEVSYGKGSVQSVIPLNDEQAVKLTVANYMTALGKEIDEIGVEPDVTLTGSENTWRQQALDLLSEQALGTGVRFVRNPSGSAGTRQSDADN